MPLFFKGNSLQNAHVWRLDWIRLSPSLETQRLIEVVYMNKSHTHNTHIHKGTEAHTKITLERFSRDKISDISVFWNQPTSYYKPTPSFSWEKLKFGKVNPPALPPPPPSWRGVPTMAELIFEVPKLRKLFIWQSSDLV